MSSYSFNARIGSHARGPVVVCGLGWPDVGMAGVNHLVGRLFPLSQLLQACFAGGSQLHRATWLGLGAARALKKGFFSQFVIAALMLVSIAGCGKGNMDTPELQENTEAYFKAHGIVPGQVNELRIGGTLFRFPAGVGLNPYTAQEAIRTKDGSAMTLSQKECLEQGKCEKVATPIVKGQADRVTFYLMPEQRYAPNPSPFGGGVRVEISNMESRTWDGVNVNLDTYLKEIKGREIIEHPASGLREYVAPKPWIGSKFEDTRLGEKSTSGYGHIFGCQSGDTGFCFISYGYESESFLYQIVVTQSFVIENWPHVHHAVYRFIDSVVVK